MFKVSRTVILHWLKRNGIEITTRKQPRPGAKQDYKNKTWRRKMLEAGNSIWVIAKDQGVAYATVRNHVLKLQPMDAKVEEKPEKKTLAKKKTAKKPPPKSKTDWLITF